MWPFRRKSLSWPTLGSVHNDGGRYVGRELGPVQPYWDAGTPVLNKLLTSSVAPDVVAKVRVGDQVEVRFEGDRWWAYVDDIQAGRFALTPSAFASRPWREGQQAVPGSGLLEVTRLLVSPNGVVQNFGGIFRPD